MVVRFGLVSVFAVSSILGAGCGPESAGSSARIAVSPTSTVVAVGSFTELLVTVDGLDLDGDEAVSIRAEIGGASGVLRDIQEGDLSPSDRVTDFGAESPVAIYLVGRVGEEATHTVRVHCVGEGVGTVTFGCAGCGGIEPEVQASVECTTSPLTDGGVDAGPVDAGPVDPPTSTPIVAYVAGPPGISSARHIYAYTTEDETVQLDPTLDPDARVEEIFVSPDGERIFFGVGGFVDRGMYSVPSDGSADPTLISRSGDSFEEVLTPSLDFSRIGYQRDAPSPAYGEFTAMTPDGAGHADLAAGTEQVQYFVGFSPDGAWAAFDANDSSGNRHLWTVRSDGTELGSMADNAHDPYSARWASTSNHIHFPGRDSSGAIQLFVGPADRSSPPTQLTTEGGSAAWLPTGVGLVSSQRVSGTETICRREPPAWDCEPLFSSDTLNLGWVRPSPDGELVVFGSWDGSSPGALYEVPTDGSRPARVVSATPVSEYELQFSTHPATPGYAFESGGGLYWRPGDMDFAPQEPIRVADSPTFFLLSALSSHLALANDSDGDGADELYVQELTLTGGGTALPPISLVSGPDDMVRGAIFIPGGIVFRHDTQTEGSLTDLFLFLFGDGEPPRRIARRDRIDDVIPLGLF